MEFPKQMSNKRLKMLEAKLMEETWWNDRLEKWLCILETNESLQLEDSPQQKHADKAMACIKKTYSSDCIDWAHVSHNKADLDENLNELWKEFSGLTKWISTMESLEEDEQGADPSARAHLKWWISTSMSMLVSWT